MLQDPRREGLLDSLERDYKLRGKWNMRVNSGMKPLREHFGTCRAIDVDSDTVNAYIEGLRTQGYAPATCNRQTQLLGQAYKQAVEAKKLTTMPLIKRLSEVGNERQGFFETEHFKVVVDPPARTPQGLCPVRLRDWMAQGSIADSALARCR